MDALERRLMTSSTDKIDIVRSDRRSMRLLRQLKWGTFGRQGEHANAVYKPIEDLDTEHIENIIITQRHYSWHHAVAFVDILKERYSSGNAVNFITGVFVGGFGVGFIALLGRWLNG